MYDKDKLYNYDVMVRRIKKLPSYMHKYIHKLEKLECYSMVDGQKKFTHCTKIPEVLYQFIFKNG
jgi:hypothetical protein